MKIVFFITTKGHGKGGHFHSLNSIANSLGKKNSVYVFNVGFQQSESLDGDYYKIIFKKYNGFNFFSTLFKINNLIQMIKPDVTHAFDIESFAFSRLISYFNRQPSFLNKCGGPNPKGYFPISNNLIMFSKENFIFFNKKFKKNSVEFFFIPNRVKSVITNQERIDKFFKKYNCLDKIKILRISRIGKHYQSSIEQSINLVHKLVKNQINAKLILIGTVQNIDVYNKIKKLIEVKKLGNEIILETSDDFTRNASQILNIGDVIIGTGRNFMEACSLNKTMLVPYKNAKYPLLVDDKNFLEVFETNFSPRTQIKNFSNKSNVDSIMKLFKRDLTPNSKNWFNEYFNIDCVEKKYTDIYLNANNTKSFYFDSFINIIFSILKFIFK